MRFSLCVAALLSFGAEAFVSPRTTTAPTFVVQKQSTSSSSSSSSDAAVESPNKTKTKKLGLLTFDLDDTLFPVAPVLEEANAAFAKAVANFGYDEVQPSDIVDKGKQIRDEIAETDPVAAAALTHTEIRKLAIRRVMEQITFERKLVAVADDWATPVSDLSPVVVQNARKWASIEITDSIVQAVYNAWEMERHHSAERHIYPELIDVFKQIREDHPDVIIGAITDGRANPLLMTFTLATYFDFCMSWEDDQSGRTQFFKELSEVGAAPEVKWIYEAALERYKELAEAKNSLKQQTDDDVDDDGDATWIHVGDDLAYDVGGSAGCGAKTILVELAEKYGQSANKRFSGEKQPDWSTTSMKELEQRSRMNEAAKKLINEKVAYISNLPEAINDIMKAENGEKQ